MLIACPYCGPRDLAEFSYQGDANRIRPDPTSADSKAWTDYVFQRTNAAGPHREFWQHAGGCRAHLAVMRDTTTHEVLSVALARDAAPMAAPAKTRRRTSSVPVPPAKRPSGKGGAPRPATAKPSTRSRKKPA